MGFFKFFGKGLLYAGLFGLGYAVHSCVAEDIRYDVRRYEGKPYLVDKVLGEKIEILRENDKMHLGGLEYRLECLIEDSRLKLCVDSLKKKWGLK